MAQIHNTDLIKELKEGGKIQQLKDVIPSQLAEKVVPVMEVNPKLLKYADFTKRNTATTSGVLTVYNIPTGRPFVMTYCSLSWAKDAASDGVYVCANGYINGLNQAFVEKRFLASVAESGQINLNFNPPIKFDAGTIISVENSFTAGSNVKALVIGGYHLDNDKA